MLGFGALYQIEKQLSIKRNKSSQGFSLLEILVSLGIFSLLIVSVASLALGSFSFFSYSEAQDTAESLAHEAIEAVKSIGNETWNELVYSRSAIDFSSGQWTLVGEGTVEQFGAFNRTIDFQDVYRNDDDIVVASTTAGVHKDVSSKIVIVNITWKSERDIPQSLVKTFLFTDWRSTAWKQNNWLSGNGQESLVNPYKYFLADNVSVSDTGIRLANISDLSSGVWDFLRTEDYIFDSNKISIFGQAFLVATGTSLSYSTINSGFTVNSSGWSTPKPWDRDPASEVLISGNRVTTGGNPSAYYRFTIPRGNGDQVGVWIEQSFSVQESNPANQFLQLDWKLLKKMRANPNTLRLYAFIDQSPGEAPMIGSLSEVWSSLEISPYVVTDWISENGIDLSNQIKSEGDYVLKIGLWIDTPESESGEAWLGIDNVKLTWGWEGATLPIDRPSFTTVVPIEADKIFSWHSFQEDATKNSGNVFYQLSPDNSHWYYFDGRDWSSATATSYNLANEVNEEIHLFSTSTKKLYLKSFLATNNNEQVTIDGIRVNYLSEAPLAWGNKFLAETLADTIAFATGTDKLSFRFTLDEQKEVNQIMLFPTVYEGGNEAGEFRVGLMADDNGKPSGGYLSSGTFVPATTGDWLSVTLSPTVNLDASSVYHVVLQRESGDYNLQLRTILPANKINFASGVKDEALNYLVKNSESDWAEQNQTPVFLLVSPNGVMFGNPVHAPESSAEVYGTKRISERFVYSGDNLKPIGFSVRAKRVSGTTPLGDLAYSLYNIDNESEIASGTILQRNMSGEDFFWADTFLNKTITLENEHTYRLEIFSEDSEQGQGYAIGVTSNDDTQTQNAINFLGENSRYEFSLNEGSSWTSSKWLDVAFQIYYKSETVGSYERTGYLISSAFFATSSIFNTIDWQEGNMCPHCQIKVWIKTAENRNGVPGIWSQYWSGPEGKDEDGTDYFEDSAGTLINVSHNGDQWVKYKVTLVGDGSATPLFSSMRINFRKDE